MRNLKEIFKIIEAENIIYEEYDLKRFNTSGIYFKLNGGIYMRLPNGYGSIYKLSGNIGHSSYATTEKIYTHKDIEELRKAIELI